MVIITIRGNTRIMNNQVPTTGDSALTTNVFEKAFAKAVVEKKKEEAEEKEAEEQPKRLERSISTTRPRSGPPRKHGLLFLYRLIGTRHLVICTLMLLVSFGGGWMFWMTEGPAEENAMEASFAAVERRNAELSARFMTKIKRNSSAFINQTEIKQFIKDSYKSMLKEEDLFKGSSFYKEQGPDYMNWRYWPAVFYASNIYMTVGYGSIQGYTVICKVMTIAFGFISIPFSFVVIRDLAQWILVGCTKIYARFLIKWRKDHGIMTEPDEDISLPYKLTLLIWILNWLAVSFCTWIYDSHNFEIDSGISYYGSMYFTYITLTSIGMSDMMPKNTTTSPLVAFWNVLGLPVYKMGCRVLYIAMENGILGTLAVVKHKFAQLDGITDPDTEAIEKYFPRKSATNKSLAGSMSAEEEKDQIQEMVNNFTVRSIATFMKSNADAYAGDFGRVKVTRASMANRRTVSESHD